MRTGTVFPAALAIMIGCLVGPIPFATAANPPLPAPGGDAAACMSDTDSLISARVRVLNDGDFSYNDNGYSTSGTSITYTNPPTDILPDGSIKASLKAALDLAPTSLKTFICSNLNYIYIDRDGKFDNPSAWAFWEVWPPTRPSRRSWTRAMARDAG